jgi:fatty acid amide hydrolase 2
MESILKLSATKIAEMILKGEITSIEAVETHIAQIKKVNPTLNAVVRDRFVEARKEAKKADRALKSKTKKKLPPLHGVPCSIKECFALTGMPNTSGLPARVGIVANKDATAVERLRAAGAIPMGVTNISELCMWMESDNRVYGRTNNPYDASRIVGGSSGGEGAIIGSGGSPFGIGSDVGGSIRMPAFFNGIFGHKPTGGMVPATGQFPTAENEALRYLTTGPLARRAEDLMPLLQIVAGPDGQDEYCEKMQLGDPAKVKFDQLNVVSVEGNGFIKVSDELIEAQRKAADALAARGANVRTVEVKKLKQSLEIWSAMLGGAGGTPFGVLLGNGEAVNGWFELMKWTVKQSDHTFPAILLAMLEKLSKLTPGRNAKMIELGHELKQELVDLIGPSGVMLFPSYATVAPVHHKPMFTPFNWVYTAIMNVMEVPVTQVPLGLNDQGLPLGVQVVGVHGNDHITIATAMALEKDLGGWVPPWEAK